VHQNLHITFGGEGNSRHTYNCIAVRRDDHSWVITCDEHPHVHTQGRLLASAARLHRRSLAITAAAPVAAVTIVVHPILPRRVHQLIEHAQILRVAATRANNDAALARKAAARALAAEHLSLRDVGTILGVSHQRAHQLIAPSPMRDGGESA
jgi:hypothetical protein